MLEYFHRVFFTFFLNVEQTDTSLSQSRLFKIHKVKSSIYVSRENRETLRSFIDAVYE